MPPSFFFPDQNAQIWLPLTKHGDYYNQVHGLGRLRKAATLEQAQLEVDGFVRNSAKETGQEAKQTSAGVFSLYEVVVGKYEVALWTLLGAVTLLVLLACANVSNLLLARSIARERELAVRFAMGAERGHIFSQLVTESVVLALFAGASGLLFGFLGIRLLRDFRLVDVTGIEHAGINFRVMLFSLGLSVFAGLVSGVMPAWRSSRKDLHPSLQQGAAGTEGRRHGELRDMLISLEVAIALVLLVSAGLLVNSFVRLTRTTWGFNPDHLLLVETKQPKSRHQESGPAGDSHGRCFTKIKSAPRSRVIGDGVRSSNSLLLERKSIGGQRRRRYPIFYGNVDRESRLLSHDGNPNLKRAGILHSGFCGGAKIHRNQQSRGGKIVARTESHRQDS